MRESFDWPPGINLESYRCQFVWKKILELQINIFSRKSQENLAKASNKGGKAVSPTDSIDLGSVVAALSFIFGNVVMAFILSFFL